MSKSYNNAIFLADPPEVIEQKLKTMITDPARKRRTDPGDPAKCPVYDLHKIFTNEETRQWVIEGCKTAGIGCLDCKGKLIPKVIEELEPVRNKRAHFQKHPEEIEEIIEEGCRKARDFAQETMELVRKAMRI